MDTATLDTMLATFNAQLIVYVLLALGFTVLWLVIFYFIIKSAIRNAIIEADDVVARKRARLR